MDAHAEFLRAAADDPELATAVKLEGTSARLTGRERATAELSERLTTAPWEVGVDAVRRLGDAGLDDLESLHVILGCAHFNYLNRVADGLGIRFDYATSLPAASSPARKAASPPPPEYQRAASQREHPFLGLEVLPDVLEAVAAWQAYHWSPTEVLDGAERTRLAALDLVLSGPDQATDPFLRHARLLTLEPWSVRRDDIEALRRHGLDDRGILELTTFIAYINFEDRARQGLAAWREARSS